MFGSFSLNGDFCFVTLQTAWSYRSQLSKLMDLIGSLSYGSGTYAIQANGTVLERQVLQE